METTSQGGESVNRRRPLVVYGLLAFAGGLTIAYWSEIVALSWYWKVVIAAVNLWIIGLVIMSSMRGRIGRMHVAMVQTMMNQGRYRQALTLADNALRIFPSSERLQTMKQECLARESGAQVRADRSSTTGGRHSPGAQEFERSIRASGMSAAGRVCTKCSGRYSNFGRRGVRAVGGAKCRSCGNFYCEPCVARALGSGTGGLTCGCGGAHASLNPMGDLALENFDELVVFPAER